MPNGNSSGMGAVGARGAPGGGGAPGGAGGLGPPSPGGGGGGGGPPPGGGGGGPGRRTPPGGGGGGGGTFPLSPATTIDGTPPYRDSSELKTEILVFTEVIGSYAYFTEYNR